MLCLLWEIILSTAKNVMVCFSSMLLDQRLLLLYYRHFALVLLPLVKKAKLKHHSRKQHLFWESTFFILRQVSKSSYSLYCSNPAQGT